MSSVTSPRPIAPSLRSLALVLVALALGSGALGCSSSKSSRRKPPSATDGGGAAAPLTGKLVIGDDGVAAWDALSATEKEKIRTFGTLFLHQSVGQDLEDGAEAAGFKFSYFGPDLQASAGLNGGIFVDVKPGLANGNPVEKLNVFRDAALRNKAAFKVVAMKLGYADVRQEDLAATQAAYQRVSTELRGAGFRVLHITPPLVFDVADNPPKIAMRKWMLATFPTDVVFDLQDIESATAGRRCEAGGVWRICPETRSTASCPSKSQGVDGDGAGHLCEKVAGRIAKALLYAIYRAGS